MQFISQDLCDAFDDMRRTQIRIAWAGVYAVVSMTIIAILATIIGCSPEPRPAMSRQSSAGPIPAAASYEVPVWDNSMDPELLILTPGQDAVLLEDIIVDARVPGERGGQLYAGKVKLYKGTKLKRPEGQ